MAGLAALRRLLMREAPAQRAPIEEALRRTARTDREHSVVGTAEGRPGRVTEGGENFVTPSPSDIRSAVHIADGPVIDFHTHPPGYTAFDVAPSDLDLQFYSSAYPLAGRELRTMIALPPRRDGARDSYGTAFNFFATDNPAAMLDPRRFSTARYELQHAARKGKFRALQDDAAMREYFDYGGDIGDLLGDVSPLMLMRLKAAQGLARHAVQLGGRNLSPNPDATDARVFRTIEPAAIEFLRAKGLARGGLAQLKECGCGGA